ncbi:Hypothetical predicted protein [Pelobates cultripes]|uniref:Reverse transcriptase domain-containing protein n=1 Tax=Pelobates cultripes TaxID=61616 RepID=A0AAD1RAM0_PELCU|nr:Hypothetical predicted protein [Pelobates cultripes]
MYTVPKIHKDLVHPPGRPIVSAKGGLIEPIAQFIDYYINNSVRKLPTCLKDTQHFISQIQDIDLTNKEIILATMDVQSLYTIIPKKEGIEAIAEILSNDDTELPLLCMLEMSKTCYTPMPIFLWVSGSPPTSLKKASTSLGRCYHRHYNMVGPCSQWRLNESLFDDKRVVEEISLGLTDYFKENTTQSSSAAWI